MDPQNPGAQDAKTQIIERLKQANNVLVTVSANPSVDQLSAAIGFTLLLNKLGKHGTAVFSGQVPETIEFLQPEATLEKNTDSLRDFIIALDKTKADKLRYKVEDRFVKIFITPYRTSITEKDLEFSQGDFNVDAVIALGVHTRDELDQAITAHGRILHDATVISVNTTPNAEGLASINWVNTNASSLCEMAVELGDALKPDIFDAQMSNAFLTGIVAETKRFSNEKARPQTMTVAGKLMAAGASQQLIAEKLEVQLPPPPLLPEEKPPEDKPSDGLDKPVADKKEEKKPEEKKDQDGSLSIEHEDKPKEEPEGIKKAEEADEEPEDSEAAGNAPKEAKDDEDDIKKIHIDDEGILHNDDDAAQQNPAQTKAVQPPSQSGSPSFVLDPPTLGGRLTANSEPEHLNLDPSTDPMTLPSVSPPLLNRSSSASVAQSPVVDSGAGDSLSNLEEKVDSPHVASADSGNPVGDFTEDKSLDDLRDAVSKAAAASPASPLSDPIAAIGAPPMVSGLNQPPAPVQNNQLDLSQPPPDQPVTGLPTDLPASLVPPAVPPTEQTAAPNKPSAPPPVPPPIVPPPGD